MLLFLRAASSHLALRRLSSLHKLGSFRQLATRMSSTHKTYGFGTKAVHAGNSPDKWELGQVVPPISLATTYKQPLPGEPIGPDYVRAGNPTRDALQENLAALENARFCKVFSSGLAATSAITNMFKTGDHIVLNNDGYGGTQRFFRRVAAKQHGLEISLVDLTSNDALLAALKPETKMVWFETPTNPLLQITDIAEVVRVVKDYNPDIIVAVDNTFSSPYFLNPLNLGADVVMHSLTKYINGHSDVLMGAAMTNREDINEHLFFMQLGVGAVASPFDCYLANRGAKTLHLRMKAHSKNGLAVAKWLEANPRVEKVLYPELESHPQHHIHKKQSKGASGMVSFYLKGGLKQSQDFLSSLKIFTLAESLGGFESLAELPSKMTHASVPAEERAAIGITDNLIRLSVGIEDKEDLIKDLDQALKKAVVVEEELDAKYVVKESRQKEIAVFA
ncbi:Gamma-cystathionase [Aphelenchoides bicaudatus]|nr:Gamma-cystathionase [Aphelenchoides bicaudatus]